MAQVGQLQVGVETEQDTTDQLMCGLGCFLVATRLRFKDAQRITEEPVLDVVDGGFGFVEANLNETKTTHTTSSKRALKVAVGHALGLDGVPWAGSWLEMRAGSNVNASAFDCLTPAPDGAGGSHKRCLKSTGFTS